MYVAADVMLVTPLRDGMNLVAKEYVASRVDESGVLILSEFAGAADELSEALLVNPYDLGSVAHAVARATTMPLAEQQRRMCRLRERVFANDVTTWANEFLDALAAATDRMAAAHAGSAVAPPDELVASLASSPRLALYLDFDGTLVDIADRPAEVTADRELQALLRKLAGCAATDVHIVSGRAPSDLATLFGDLPIHLHAEHGFWSRAPNEGWRSIGDPSSPWKREVLRVLTHFAARTPGAFVEDKPVSASWHYRMSDPELASARLREIRLALADVLATHQLDVLAGAKALEVRRRGANKGHVIVRTAPEDSAIIAIGDDRTDEDMFAAVGEATSIRVGAGPTRAAYRCASPDAVRALLSSLANQRAPRS
jgi:trehalose 6-phosphate synthase/phosphatase